MKVRFRTRASGPTGNFKPGEIAEVDEAWGKLLIESGSAILEDSKIGVMQGLVDPVRTEQINPVVETTEARKARGTAKRDTEQ